MCPEYQQFHDVPGGLQLLVRAELERLGLEMSVLSQTGFAFVAAQRENGQLVRIEKLSDLSEGQRLDAKKSSSNRHVILPLKNSSRHKPRQVSVDRPVGEFFLD